MKLITAQVDNICTLQSNWTKCGGLVNIIAINGHSSNSNFLLHSHTAHRFPL